MKPLLFFLICLVGASAWALEPIRDAARQRLETQAKACSGKRALVKITANDAMGSRGVVQALGTKRRSKRVNPPLEVILVTPYPVVIGEVWEGYISFDTIVVDEKNTDVRKGKDIPRFRGIAP